MPGLHRTPLTTPSKIECVVKALAGQEALGGIAALSREFGISRPTIHAAKEVASEVLGEHFEATGSDRVCVEVDKAQLRRAVVALRVVSPNAFKEWPEIFNNDSTLTSALLARLLHYAETWSSKARTIA